MRKKMATENYDGTCEEKEYENEDCNTRENSKVRYFNFLEHKIVYLCTSKYTCDTKNIHQTFQTEG